MVNRLLGAIRPWHLGLALTLLVAATAVDGLSSMALAQEAAAGEGQVAPVEPENALIWIAKTSGFIGAVLLGLSIYFVSTVCRMFAELRPIVVAPPDIVNECQELLQKRQFKEVYNVVKDDTSFFSRVLSTGISELPSGLSEARESMERVAEGLTVEMEKKISMLAVLGTLGPMIGLLGTLKGMIASFSVIARSDQMLKASDVAGGISEALLLTFEGVALSVPAIYFFAVFRNRVSSLTVTTMMECDEFLRHFAHAARSKTPPAAAAAAPAAPAKARHTRARSCAMSGSVSSDNAEPNLTPMLDMVFQLITFFMLIMNFKSAAMDLTLKLPVVGSAKMVDTKGTVDLLVLNVDAEGKLRVYGQEKPDIQRYLQTEAMTSLLVARRKDPDLKLGDELPSIVVIRADKATPFRLLNRVITTCQEFGFRNFALKAMNKTEGG